MDFVRSHFGKMQWLAANKKEMVFCFQKWSDLQWEKIVLNYGFCKNHFGKMQLWQVEHCTGTFLWRKKCSTSQSCIFPKWFLQNP